MAHGMEAASVYSLFSLVIIDSQHCYSGKIDKNGMGNSRSTCRLSYLVIFMRPLVSFGYFYRPGLNKYFCSDF